MWMETVHKPEDDSKKCPTCGGGVRGRIRCEMYAGSFVLNGVRVEIRAVPNELAHDPIVLDAITQYFDGGLYRARPSDPYFARGGRLLHREVWRLAFGAIPENCHIHHRDSNAANNRIENLECIDRNEHFRIPKSVKVKFSENCRRSAAAWHGSEAGRLWHTRHALESKGWTKWKREERPCDFCGKSFLALVRKNAHPHRFCSQTCKALAYRKRARDSAKG